MMDLALRTALDVTWPAAGYARVGGIRIGRQPGGGKRLNAAWAASDWTEADVALAIDQQRSFGARPLFAVMDGDLPLTQALAARGMDDFEPTAILHAPISLLTDQPLPPMGAFAVWPPLAIQRELWVGAQIGPGRQAAIDRAPQPKAALLGRVKDRAAGVGFVGVCGPVAIVHALSVLPEFRRMGVAGWMMRRAAGFAAEKGADRIAVAVTRANTDALALYDSMGFTEAAGYRYFAEPGPDGWLATPPP